MITNKTNLSKIEEYGAIYFYKENNKNFPILTKLALRFLALPATSVSVQISSYFK